MKVIKHDHMKEVIFDPASFDIFADPKYLEYRKNWTGYPERRHVSNYPLNLDIHVTNRCNLRCVMCRRTMEMAKGLYDKTGFLDYELYKMIIDEAAREGCCAVHLTGNGEPLLHNKITDMIRYAHDRKIMDVFMHTNATLMSRDVAAELLQAGLTRLLLSFDSPVKETYESIRRGAKFEVVKDNIDTLVALKKKMGLKYPLIRIQMVDMKANAAEIELFNEMFKDLDGVGHSSYINYKGIDDEDRAIKNKSYRKDYICDQLWQRLTIEWDGRVYACLVINEELCLGKFPEKSVKEMWHGHLMTKLRETHKAGGFAGIRACEACGRQYKAK